MLILEALAGLVCLGSARTFEALEGNNPKPKL